MNITSGKIQSAQKVVVYGPEGIGKSTFASKFPEPLFIDTEGSTKQLDVKRFDKPTSWEMLIQEVNYVISNKPCKTLIIDTIDWAEQLCIDSICAKYQKNGIEDFGYGNGYVYEKELFGRFLNLLTEVIDVGINVVLTAHAILRKFEQPDELGAYDRWELKLGKKTTNMISPLVKEWADMVLFANYKTFSVAIDKDGKKHKAQGGQRVMFSAHHPCWDAKNRNGLPEEIPMDYEVIRHIVEPIVTLNVSESVVQAPTQIQNIEQPNYKGTNLDESLDESPETNDIPKNLLDLMKANNVSPSQIQGIVADKGYFPIATPISQYPKDFIDGVLVGAWSQVYAAIIATEDKEF